ncbi:MAG: hypothetical protein R3B48_20410 [Kofleriaceae bacterium]
MPTAPRPPPHGRIPACAGLAVLAGLASALGCRAPHAPAPGTLAPREPSALRPRSFELRFEGAPIGATLDEEERDGERVRLRRQEHLRFRRGDERVHLDLALDLAGSLTDGAERADLVIRRCARPLLDAPPGAATGGRLGATTAARPATSEATPSPVPAALVALAASLPTCASGEEDSTTWGAARRDPDGWLVRDARGARRLPPEAEPAEWLELVPPEPAARARTLFFPARGFALGHARHAWIGPRTWTGEVRVGDDALSATTELGHDERPRRILDSSGLTSERRRVGAPLLHDEPARLADLVALTTLTVAGSAPSDGGGTVLAFSLAAPAALPPAVVGQRVQATAGGWLVQLEPTTVAPAERALVAQAAQLARAIAADTPVERLPGAGGDCTARALRFAAAARARGWRVRLATGLVLDGAALVRHRWIHLWTGARWLPVDPSSGDAPAPPVLVALALHPASARALVASEGAFSAVRGAVVHFAR